MTLLFLACFLVLRTILHIAIQNQTCDPEYPNPGIRGDLFELLRTTAVIVLLIEEVTEFVAEFADGIAVIDDIELVILSRGLKLLENIH